MPLTGFPVVVEIPVLWGDQDLFRHVNNTVPVKWFESSRVAYWELPGVREVIVESHLGPILAQVHCNYRHQLRYPDTIQVGARVQRLGRTSIFIEHQVFSYTHDKITTDGHSVIILFDYREQRPAPLSDDLRRVIETIEGKPLPANSPPPAGGTQLKPA
jgi:acyl-CoA thioester hydrolase